MGLFHKCEGHIITRSHSMKSRKNRKPAGLSRKITQDISGEREWSFFLKEHKINKVLQFVFFMRIIFLYVIIFFVSPVCASDDEGAYDQCALLLPGELSKRLVEEEIESFKDRVSFGLTCKEAYTLLDAHAHTQATAYLIPPEPRDTFMGRLDTFLGCFRTPSQSYTVTVEQLQHFMTVPYEDPVYPSSWVFRVGDAWFQLINDHGITLNQQFRSSPQSLPETYLDKLNPKAVMTFEHKHDFEGYRAIHDNGMPYFEKFRPCLSQFQLHACPWEQETRVFRAPLMIHAFAPQQGLDLRLLNEENLKEHLDYLSHTFAAVSLHDFWVRPLEGFKPQG